MAKKRDTPELTININSNSQALKELKHSMQLHLMMYQGPNNQLCIYGLKSIDFIDKLYLILAMTPDKAKEELEKLETEISSLAFSIVEALALFIQRSVDERKAKANNQGLEFPENIRQKGDEILVMLGKSRGLPDKIAAKNAVLKGMADTLRALSTFTKATYPDLRDSAGNVL